MATRSSNNNGFLTKLFNRTAFTENGAISNITTESAVLDYFAKSGTYRDRELEMVFADMNRLWHESPEMTLQIIFYNRMITRNTEGFLESDKVQKGQGNRSEFRKCLIWLAKTHADVLYKNLWLVPVAGCWKDLWHQDLIDVLDHESVFNLIAQGLQDQYNAALLAKYLPKYRSKSNTYNERHIALNAFAKGLMKYMKWNEAQYRKFKSGGKAHDFQRIMCANKWESLQFYTIPGKALFQLVNNKGADRKTALERHDLEYKYLEWTDNQPVAKFTGYVYELMHAVKHNMTAVQQTTIDKQFDGLIALAEMDQKIRENVWCALDTSGSMMAPVANTNAYNICISLGIYFSSLNKGAFKNHVVMFDDGSRVMKLTGTFTQKVRQIQKANTAWGSTNFQSVITEIVRVRKKHPEIPVSDYPSTLIVVSDMQFNPAGSNAQSNYSYAMQRLAEVGLPKIRIVWWYVTGRGSDFPSNMNDKDVVMIGGFDGSIISTLIGEKVAHKSNQESLTAYEAMQKALNQEVLQQFVV
ncbi:DUF2828 family protein [bacterium]|nr:DUF2828 family protein [bacterium]